MASLNPQKSLQARALYQSRRVAGLCVSCGGALNRDGSRCRSCANKASKRASRRMLKMREAGLCHCGKVPLPGISTCAACTQRNLVGASERYHRRRAAGCCVTCGEPMDRDSGVYCSGCCEVRRMKQP